MVMKRSVEVLAGKRLLLLLSVPPLLLLLPLLPPASALPNKDDWDIYSFHINATVSGRYASTVITSRVVNRVDQPKEMEFHVRIPKQAFISNFRMFIDGQVFDGQVKAREQAQRQYVEAVGRGQSAGIVSSVGRTLEEFRTSVTVAAHNKVTFELTYEELLVRRHGRYELQIHARPMQPVRDFKLEVYMQEEAGISFMVVGGGLSTKALANAITKTHQDTQAWLYFYPTEDQQRNCDSCGEQGMNGDLVITYDVKRDASLGHIKMSDGYFVHHFAPSSLSRIPKNVIFIIDRSGSMSGRKMEQTRLALLQILGDLSDDDFFGLITFDSHIFRWKQELVRASPQNIDSARTFVREIQERGATDINRAVLEGASMLNAHPREGSASILILLTDGDPTSGVTNLERIQSNVREVIGGKFPLYCLGFGLGVNFDFLQTMALQNKGAARRIYEDADADVQLKGFYEEVATPLLTDVTMTYVGGANLTQTHFSQYYNGSEIVVAGQIAGNNVETFAPQVVAISGTRRMSFTPTNGTLTAADRRLQRVWAFLTVKQLLEKMLQVSGAQKEQASVRALQLSLKYGFVTPLTSMVVTKPQGETSDVLHKPKEGAGSSRAHRPSQTTSNSHVPGAPGVFGQLVPRTKDSVILYQTILHAPDPPIMTASTGRIQTPVFLDEVSAPDPMDYSAEDVVTASSYFVTDAPVDYNLLPTIAETEVSEVPPTSAPAPPSHRFLLKAENQTLPLCFDVTGNKHLRLLRSPATGVSMSGELDSTGGFSRITISFRELRYMVLLTRDGLGLEQSATAGGTAQELNTTGSVSVLQREQEVDVVMGDTRIVVFLFDKEGGRRFLWPALRQHPADHSADGILALKSPVYEELHQTTPKLKIKNQEVEVIRSRAADHSISSAPMLDCWLVPAQAALQHPLEDLLMAAPQHAS